MKRLGYTRYVAQGGDWGAPISGALVLDDITLYWLTNSAVSSSRLYWENAGRGVISSAAQKTTEIRLPVAISVFPEEVYRPPCRLGNRRGMALAQSGLGIGLGQIGKFEAAQGAFAASLAIYREIGDKWAMSFALLNQGEAASDQGNYALARASLEESMSIHRADGDLRALGRTLASLGRNARRQGDVASAAALLGDALTILRTLGDRPGVANATDELASLALMQDRTVDAQALHRDALSIHRAVGAWDRAAGTFEGIANAVAATSPLAAARLWGHAQCIRERTGAPFHPQDKTENDRLVAVARKTLGDAAAFDAAWRDGRAMTFDQAVQYAMSPQPPA